MATASLSPFSFVSIPKRTPIEIDGLIDADGRDMRTARRRQMRAGMRTEAKQAALDRGGGLDPRFATPVDSPPWPRRMRAAGTRRAG